MKWLQVESACDNELVIAMASPIMSRKEDKKSSEVGTKYKQHNSNAFSFLMLEAFVNMTFALPCHWWGIFSNIGSVLDALF